MSSEFWKYKNNVNSLGNYKFGLIGDTLNRPKKLEVIASSYEDIFNAIRTCLKLSPDQVVDFEVLDSDLQFFVEKPDDFNDLPNFIQIKYFTPGTVLFVVVLTF